MLQLGTGIALVAVAATQVPATQRVRAGVGQPAQIREVRSQERMPCRVIANSGSWSLEGTLITPDQVIDQGIITIEGKKIAAVKAVRPGPSCSTKIDGIILPGLIDLHNHLTWNVHPRWQPPQQYSNRAEWRLSAEHKETLVEPQDRVVWPPQMNSRLGCQANLYGEVRALVGGATSAVGGLNIIDYGQGRCITGLIRNLDYGSEFSDVPTKGGLFDVLQAAQGRRSSIDPCAGQNPDGDPVVDVAVNVIFPLGIENGVNDIPALTPARAAYLKCNLNSGRLRSLLVHLAEGIPTDRQSRQEFADLEALGLVQEGLIIVHGMALQPRDFVAMKSGDVGLVWSPRSNMELYGATLDLLAARNADVTIAIAPDWSPTGSDGMLQELSYARAKFGDFNSKQLTMMATSIPARIARIDDRIGQLKAGMYADLLVIRRKEGSAYDSVVTASPADVQLVVIDGRPVYGDSVLMQQLLPGKNLAQMTICGASKAVDLSDTIAAQSSWNAVKTELQERLGEGLHPASLASLGCPVALPIKRTPGPVTIPDIIHVPDPGRLEN
jgi:5-methylthioadenosine/S-adenosylhomocysteine deaminase